MARREAYRIVSAQLGPIQSAMNLCPIKAHQKHQSTSRRTNINRYTSNKAKSRVPTKKKKQGPGKQRENKRPVYIYRVKF